MQSHHDTNLKIYIENKVQVFVGLWIVNGLKRHTQNMQ